MTFRNWWQKVRKKFKIRKKLYKRKKKIQFNKPKKEKVSIATIYKKNKITSKINVKDIELIEGMEAKDLKKQYGVTGSKCKILDAMVTDYKQGRLSLPGMSHKSKFDAKNLDKDKLNQILTNYDTAKTKRNDEDRDILKKNVALLTKKYKLTASRKNLLEKMLNDLKKRSDFELIKSQLNPKIVDKEKVDKLIAQYEAAQKQNRGISFLLTRSKLSFLASKRKFSALMSDLKDVHISDYLMK